MKYEERIVLFIDILGFREQINSTVHSPTIDDEIRIQELYDSLNLMKLTSHWQQSSSRQVTQFSDSIIISFLPSDDSGILLMLGNLMTMLMMLIERKILFRGAFAFGKMVHSDTIVFGPAVNEAYEAESKAAIYPRIILSESVLNRFNPSAGIYKYLYGDSNLQEAFFKRDLDDKFYLDYFLYGFKVLGSERYCNAFLPALRTVIELGLTKRKPDLETKYGWMKLKYNEAISFVEKNPNLYFNEFEPGFNSISNLRAIL